MAMMLEDDDYMRYLNNQKEDGDELSYQQNDDDDELIDPVYKIFLEHLREDGKSFVFEMANGDRGLPAIVKYEEDDVLFEKSELDTQRNSGYTPFEERGYCTTKRRWSRKKSSSKSTEVVDLSAVPNSQSELSLVEESYLTFLNHLKFNGSSMVLEYNSVSVTYEEIGEKDSSESLTTEDNGNDEQALIPYKSSEPSDLTVYEDNNRSMISLDSCESSEFKTELTAILSKPYDQNEYEELLEEATERKLLNKQKHLRSMSISYPTKEFGMSYLDHFPDLAKQIWSADCQRRLNLLRGFFFWLKNLCHEGAFMPWVSSSYGELATDDYEIVIPLEIARDEN